MASILYVDTGLHGLRNIIRQNLQKVGSMQVTDSYEDALLMSTRSYVIADKIIKDSQHKVCGLELALEIKEKQGNSTNIFLLTSDQARLERAEDEGIKAYDPKDLDVLKRNLSDYLASINVTSGNSGVFKIADIKKKV